MPKLWNETISAHRQAVRDALLDTTAELVAEHGLASVTMTQIAEATGIGRATLYKYFPDVDSILMAWHERRINGHLEQLAAIVESDADTARRLEKVLSTYALIDYSHHGGEWAPTLHQSGHAVHAQHRLHELVRQLLAEGAAVGTVRADVPPEELARYCLAALSAASSLRSKAAVRRLVVVTLDGLRPS
ncbi:TetR/AcrR family transcriptional regulator [Nocardia barduliensis]|uniref:TetR/AcrR family transcriptional regulator n=1 Tax=Nocardia barduliensis TaxID=2736643 RepID=UPI0015716E2F|nr:TetR/AcrR family transcriptional regulator [Nocardia barduliensis]